MIKNKPQTMDDVIQQELKNTKFQKTYDQTVSAGNAAIALYEFRHELGYTQAQLAQKAGLAKSTIVRIETGIMNPRLETLQQIADSVGAHVELKFVH